MAPNTSVFLHSESSRHFQGEQRKMEEKTLKGFGILNWSQAGSLRRPLMNLSWSLWKKRRRGFFGAERHLFASHIPSGSEFALQNRNLHTDLFCSRNFGS